MIIKICFYATPVWNKPIPSSITKKIKVCEIFCREQIGESSQDMSMLQIYVSLMTTSKVSYFQLDIAQTCTICFPHFYAYIKTNILSGQISPLKGLCNIVQMRNSGAKVVTSMLDVQLKIIWKFERKRTIIHGTNWEKLIRSIP